MRAIVLLLAAALCCGSVRAAVPHEINYQGYLTSPGGAPVNATVQMVLKLYDVATAGTALHSETQSVVVANGVFSVLLGAQPANLLVLPFDVPYWLGVKVEADAEMAPRQQVAASAYAIRSSTTESLAATATVPAAQIIGAVGSAATFTGILAGDVTGTQGATAVGTVGGITAANVAAGANLAIAATNANIANTLVRRDASGNLAAGTIVAAGDLSLSATNAAGTAGVINQAGSRLVHSYGSANFFAGSGAGNFSMTGGNNTGAGANALSSSTSGGQNTANGSQALPANTSGGQNTATGYAALLGNTGGGSNTAIGVNALQANTIGNFNTAGGAAALASSNGNSNTAIGFGAGSNLTAGDNNIYVGNAGIATESNTVRIGNPAVHTTTLLAGRVGLPTPSTSAVLPTRLNVVADSPKTVVATTRVLAVTTNDATAPFALDIKLVGAAALADRSVILQTTDWNASDGGKLLLQPQGGNVGIGAGASSARLAVAGVIESTSGGVKFPDGTVQTTAGSGGVFNVEGPRANILTAVDTLGDVGQYTSITVAPDGLPVMSYSDATNGDLKVAKCGNAACSSGNTLTAVDTAGLVGRYSSIVIGADGLPVVSYDDQGNGTVKVAKCGNAACSSANTLTTVASTSGVSWYTAIAIGADGLPVISYRDSSVGTLKMVHCGNIACSAGNTTRTVDASAQVGEYSSIAVGVDGLPVIAYYDNTNSYLKVAHCGDVACEFSATLATIDIAGVVGEYPSLAIGADGLPVISYRDATANDLKVAKCGNANCSAGNTLTAVDTAGVVGLYTSIAIGTDGLPVISYYDGSNGNLKFAKCGNAACSAGNTLGTMDSAGNLGQYTSITIGADGLPVTSYYDASNGDLKVAKCGNAFCAPYFRRR